ncbi:response regulator [Actinoplanes sp. TRM 88003]|uniref:histidine kinase n=1 Tax=Paractinoplanes aksuensis TaxID=2939490 RepID=A0ABT1DH72_9ACTN|nr:response regulator [Actinoplanes aksuensis]MCO8270169.1 response regulator [Actinoplanes aksuensis]
MATVMVVDDVAANRDIVRLLLGYRGHEVIEAHDGADALRLAHEHHPDVVVSDVLMPGIDGLELVHRLRTDDDELAAQAPVIFYTANYLEPETRPIAEACGVSQVVLRSQDPHELLDAVDAALASGPVSIDVVPSDDFAQAHVQAVNAKLIEKVRALHHTERRFEAMAVASPVGIALIDADGEADYINPRLAEIMRTPISGLLGRGWLACLDAPARRDALDLLRGNAAERRFTNRIEYPDGAVRHLRVQLRHIQDDDAELAGGVLMVDDVSDVITAEEGLRDEIQRRQADARRRDAERLDSLRRMAGGAAHDFNNILGAILGYTSLAIETVTETALPDGTSASLLADLDQVIKGGERAKALTQQLLAFGRREITQPATFDINGLLQEMIGALRDSSGEASVVLQLRPGPAEVRADPRQISQVLVNLVANAADAMPGGGAITIATAGGDERDTTVTVTDTGRGMPADVLDRAFEPFFTTKRSTGTAGLGLSTAHGIVSQAGGQLTLASTPGAGTTATIRLPCVRDGAAPGTPVPGATRSPDASPPSGAASSPGVAPSSGAGLSLSAEPSPDGLPTVSPDGSLTGSPGGSGGSGGETLLLVDDEADLREVTARFLGGAGYRVLSAADAAEALNLLARHNDPIAAMITDVVMPGMNGRQLARVAKQRRPDLRVVFVSGFAEALIDEAGNNLEPDSLIVAKPYTRDQLLAAVQSVLRQT